MSERKMMPEFEFFVGGVALVCVGVIGCLLNILCIITFSRMSAQKNFHRLMLSLALFDILYITTSIALFGLPALYPYVYNNNFYLRLIPVILPLIHIGLTGSIYLTVAIALERYTTVCHPFFKLTHAWSAATYILPICIFSLLYNIPKFLELEIGTFPLNNTQRAFYNQTEVPSSTMSPEMILMEDEDIKETIERNITVVGNMTDDPIMMERVVPSTLRKHPLYVQVYIIYLNLLVHGLVPLVLLVGLNICTYRRLRLYHNTLDLAAGQGTLQLREVRLSQVSLVIVVVFVFCHGIRWIPNIWELQHSDNKENLKWPVWIAYITHVSHLLTVFNSSVNFFIYLVKHPNVLFKSMRRPQETQPNGTADVTTILASKKISVATQILQGDQYELVEYGSTQL